MAEKFDDKKLGFLEWEPEEITESKLEAELNTLFYKIRSMKGYSPEAQEKLYDCLDAGFGVMCLMSDLKGTGYDLVTFEDGHRDYVKKEPVDPNIIYARTNELIDRVNSLTDPNYKSVYEIEEPTNE